MYSGRPAAIKSGATASKLDNNRKRITKFASVRHVLRWCIATGRKMRKSSMNSTLPK
jgi:hypothetical protein